jgi:hypothetical protein
MKAIDENRKNFDRKVSPHGQYPWNMTVENMNDIKKEILAMKLPRGYGRLKNIIDHTGWLKCHDFVLLSSPLG